MRVVILNTKVDALHYDKYKRSLKDIVIPLGPEVRHLAIEKKWKFCSQSELWENNVYDEARRISEIKIKRLVKKLNVYSKDTANNFPLTIGDYFYFQLFIVIGQIHFNRFILDSIYNTLSPTSWLVYGSETKKLFMGFRPDSESIIYETMKFSPYINNCEVVWNNMGGYKASITKKQQLKNALPIKILDYLYSLKNILKSRNIFSRRKRKLLMNGAIYDWQLLFQDSTFKANYYVNYMKNEQLSRQQSFPSTLNDILNQSIDYNGSKAFDLSEQAKIIYGTLVKMDSDVLTLKNKIKEYHGILSTCYVFPEQNLIGHLASTLGVPIVNWQHGEKGVSFEGNFDKYTELLYTSDYFCFGNLVVEYFEKHIDTSPLKRVFSVGTIHKNVNWKLSKYIVYSTGKWMKTATPFICARDPDTRLYNAQNIILEYLNKVGLDNDVIFKTSNTPGLNENIFYKENIQIIDSIPFTTLLKEAKLVILDSPGTTCIETCSTEVPLFILTGRVPCYKHATKLLRKRAVLASNTNDLIKYIEDYMLNGTYPADIHNNEFFLGYGGTTNINEVKKNALSALQQVVL